MNRTHIEALLVGLLIGGVFVPLARALHFFPNNWSHDAIAIGLTTGASVLIARYVLVVVLPGITRLFTA